MECGAVGHNFERDPPRDHPCQVRFNLVQWFQRRRFKCESLRRTTDAKWWQKAHLAFWPGELKMQQFIHSNTQKYSQACFKRSPLGQRKGGLIRQLTSQKRFNSFEIFYDRTIKRWPFNACDCLIKMTTWEVLTAFTCLHICWNWWNIKSLKILVYLQDSRSKNHHNFSLKPT